MASVSIKMNEDGSFILAAGATDLGTGSDTVLAQAAAEILGVEVSDVVVHSSDTDLTPFDVGAYASSTTYLSGEAARRTAIEVALLDEHRRIAVGERLGIDELMIVGYVGRGDDDRRLAHMRELGEADRARTRDDDVSACHIACHIVEVIDHLDVVIASQLIRIVQRLGVGVVALPRGQHEARLGSGGRERTEHIQHGGVDGLRA